jgi:hypothetical protein
MSRKNFLREPFAPGGGRKIENQKSKRRKSKIAKIENRNFRLWPKKLEKVKIQQIARAFFAVRRSQNGTFRLADFQYRP